MDGIGIALFCLHLFGLVLGIGGGIALARVGPQFIAATPADRELLWSLEEFFNRMGVGGLLLLIVTGPLMVWHIFGGFDGFTHWFYLKMVLVAAALAGALVHSRAAKRFYLGDVGKVPLMYLSGRIAGIGMVLAMICAVLNFE